MTGKAAQAIAFVMSLVTVSALATPAWAQVAPPPAEIPRQPDVPLPEWKPQPQTGHTLVLGVSQELRRPE